MSALRLAAEKTPPCAWSAAREAGVWAMRGISAPLAISLRLDAVLDKAGRWAAMALAELRPALRIQRRPFSRGHQILQERFGLGVHLAAHGILLALLSKQPDGLGAVGPGTFAVVQGSFRDRLLAAGGHTGPHQVGARVGEETSQAWCRRSRAISLRAEASPGRDKRGERLAPASASGTCTKCAPRVAAPETRVRAQRSRFFRRRLAIVRQPPARCRAGQTCHGSCVRSVGRFLSARFPRFRPDGRSQIKTSVRPMSLGAGVSEMSPRRSGARRCWPAAYQLRDAISSDEQARANVSCGRDHLAPSTSYRSPISWGVHPNAPGTATVRTPP